MPWSARQRPCASGDQGRCNLGSEGSVGSNWAKSYRAGALASPSHAEALCLEAVGPCAGARDSLPL